jgi:hypothetical protein
MLENYKKKLHIFLFLQLVFVKKKYSDGNSANFGPEFRLLGTPNIFKNRKFIKNVSCKVAYQPIIKNKFFWNLVTIKLCKKNAYRF